MTDEQKVLRKQKSKEWYATLKADPVRWAARQEAMKIAKQKWSENPANKEKAREYAKKYQKERRQQTTPQPEADKSSD